MMRPASLHLDILPRAQRVLWDELRSVATDFTLYGGTAIALRLGHRQSIDFDFFAPRVFDPDTLMDAIPFLHQGTVVQKEANTLTVIVDRGDPVQVSFFGVPRLGQVYPPELIEDTGIHVASLFDLAATKVALVQRRAEVRDYIDIDAIITAGQVGLAAALSGAKIIYGFQFSPQISLKALSYFGDGSVPQLESSVRERLLIAVKSIDLDNLPDIVPYRTRSDEQP